MVRGIISPRPELLLEEELELLDDDELLLEEELELVEEEELELLDEELLLEEELEPPELVPPQAASMAVNSSAGTSFILWYFRYAFIKTPN